MYLKTSAQIVSMYLLGIFIAQVLLIGLEASNTRIMHLPVNLGFNKENIKNSSKQFQTFHFN